ncbi:MAG: PGF-pre-PGF domain-containing protein, partial [Euryarchaeota archaeon]|nr:PGF-pre-PGF domain-containing protein [Euryarchaeota archaeon]
MKSTSQTSKHRRYASIGITVAIVMMLVLSGPVGAVTLSIDGLTGTHTQGDSVTFNVTATINNPDTYVPIENFSLDITGATSKEVVFSTDGTILSGDPGITVTELTGPSANEYGYGDGYGYDSNVGYGYSFGFGYGYGYGYGSGVGGAVEYTYEITLDTSTLNTGSHDATLALNTGDSAKPSFESSSASFTIQAASTGGGGGDGTEGATITGGESYENILFKDANRQTVSAGAEVRYDFGGDDNPIKFAGFTPLTNAGNVFMTVEVLKDTSEFVDTPPTGTVYRNLNIWLGNVVKKSDIT